VTLITYTRPEDGKYWAYKCRLEGDRVHWGPANGNWARRIVLQVEPGTKTLSIRVTDPDGSQTFKSYALSEIQ